MKWRQNTNTRTQKFLAMLANNKLVIIHLFGSGSFCLEWVCFFLAALAFPCLIGLWNFVRFCWMVRLFVIISTFYNWVCCHEVSQPFEFFRWMRLFTKLFWNCNFSSDLTDELRQRRLMWKCYLNIFHTFPLSCPIEEHTIRANAHIWIWAAMKSMEHDRIICMFFQPVKRIVEIKWLPKQTVGANLHENH